MNVSEACGAGQRKCCGVGGPRFPWEPLLLGALVSAVYFSRLDAVPFRGEETRWARVAWEMRETGDWIVPRQQGRVFADRPPLGSWCMLLASALTGSLDRFSVRFPTALATVLTSLVLYGYCRQFLTRWGAFTAGVVYATFPQTLQLGRFAESDAVFTLFMAAALLTWHTGYVRRWPRTWTWIAGYLLAALAGLAKGPQGPVYFVATVTVFLALKRDWLFLFSLSHAAGVLVFAAVLGAWQIPFARAVGAESTMAVWSEEGTFGSRLIGILGARWWAHVATYPAEVFMYLLPWSVFLFALLRPPAWREGEAREHVVFLLVSLAIAFPTCWLVMKTRPRHLMSLFPAVACLIAIAIDRCCYSPSAPQRDWGFRWFVTVTGALAALLGAVVTIAGVWPAVSRATILLTPSWSTVACGAAMLLVAIVCFWARAGSGPARAAAAVAAVAAALALGFVVLVVDHQARIADDLEAQVAHLKTDILRGARLVSFGPVFHKFTFYYQDPIEIVPWPRADVAADPPWRYFCFMQKEASAHGKLPFAWDQVALLYCDRAKHKGRNHLLVGRRKAVTP